MCEMPRGYWELQQPRNFREEWRGDVLLRVDEVHSAIVLAAVRERQRNRDNIKHMVQ